MYPSPQQLQFLDAAERGDADTVQKFLAAGVDVNTRDDRRLPRNRTALMHAARNGHLGVIEALLAAGADLDARDRGLGAALPGGNTALLLAVKHRQVRAARLLLEAGADPRAASAGVTVLAEAAYLGDAVLLRRLLKSGLDPNGRSGPRADAPLACALYGRQTEAVRTLLSAGADPNRIGRGGLTPLEIAIRDGLTEAAQILVRRGVNLEHLTAKGLTLLTVAVQHGRKEFVEILLRRGANPNARGRKGQTALDMAIRCVEQGIERTASSTPRSTASRFPEPSNQIQDIIHVLIAAGARTSDQLPRPRKGISPSISVNSNGPPRIPRSPAIAKFGIRDFLELARFTEPDFSLLAVEAPMGKAAASFAAYRKIRRWVADIPRQKTAGIRRTASSVVTAARAGTWTVIFRSLFGIGPEDSNLAAEEAKELSRQLKTRAVTFYRDSANDAVGFDLFQKGRLAEHARWTEHGPLREFESRFRRRPAPEDSAEDYVDRIFAALKIYIPACYPRYLRKRPVLCVEPSSLSAVERADLLVLPRTKARDRR